MSIAVKTFGVCDFSRLAVTDWRLRRWRLWFLALMTATQKILKIIFFLFPNGIAGRLWVNTRNLSTAVAIDLMKTVCLLIPRPVVKRVSFNREVPLTK